MVKKKFGVPPPPKKKVPTIFFVKTEKMKKWKLFQIAWNGKKIGRKQFLNFWEILIRKNKLFQIFWNDEKII